MSKTAQVRDEKKNISQLNIIYQPKKNQNIPILTPFGIKNGISQRQFIKIKNFRTFRF